jgi:hypothetical protein
MPAPNHGILLAMANGQTITGAIADEVEPKKLADRISETPNKQSFRVTTIEADDQTKLAAEWIFAKEALIYGGVVPYKVIREINKNNEAQARAREAAQTRPQQAGPRLLVPT